MSTTPIYLVRHANDENRIKRINATLLLLENDLMLISVRRTRKIKSGSDQAITETGNIGLEIKTPTEPRIANRELLVYL